MRFKLLISNIIHYEYLGHGLGIRTEIFLFSYRKMYFFPQFKGSNEIQIL